MKQQFISSMLNLISDDDIINKFDSCFQQIINCISEEFKTKNCILLVPRPFSGMESRDMSYWVYTPQKMENQLVIEEIEFIKSTTLRNLRENKTGSISLKSDTNLFTLIKDTNIEVVENDLIMFGECLLRKDKPIGFLLIDNDKKNMSNHDSWTFTCSIIKAINDKVFFLYEEKNRIQDVLSHIASSLQRSFIEYKDNSVEMDILQRVLDSSREYLHAEKCALFLVDSSGKSLLLERGSGKMDFEKIKDEASYNIEINDDSCVGNGVTPWVLFRKKPFNARNFQELIGHSEGHWKGKWDATMYEDRKKVESNFQCVYMVPLFVKERNIGVLKYENIEPDVSKMYFDQSDERIIDIIGSLVTNLVISQRIERNRYDNALPSISKTLISTFGNKDFYEELLEKCRKILNAQICSLFLVEKDNSLSLKAIVGVDESIKRKLEENNFSYPDYTKSKGLTPMILRNGESFNVRNFPDLKGRSNNKHIGQWDKIVYHDQPEKEFRSLYSTPLIIGDEPIGVFKIENKLSTPYYFTESDERLFDLIGRLIVVAVKYERDLQFGDMLKAAEIGFLSSGIAHEFNTYLTRFQGIAENIESDNSISDSKIQNLMDEINKADRTIKNFRQIRDRSQDVELFDIDNLIKQLIHLSNKRFSINNIQLDYKNKNIKNVFLNPSDVQTIIINLLNNAFDSVIKKDEQKYISLKVSKFNINKIMIECKDSGEGISDEDSPGIFVPFHSTKGDQGMGIGLYWVDRLAKNMDGTIEVINKNELGGATFKVILPLNNKLKE